ncbi:MAG: WecB/TagA/CpsF family glycosyltransferase, partial [Candidatus Hodarchaeota archaeon]
MNSNRIDNLSPVSRVNYLMGTFSRRSFASILEEMDRAIGSREAGRYIAITNTESIYHALHDDQHQRYIRNAAFSCCDGIGVVFAGRLLGHRIPRLHGPDLMLECCRFGVQGGWKHFFFGGKAGIPERLSGNLTAIYPGLITVGTYSPPFRTLTKQEDDAIIEMINVHNPDVLWVGLGLPKQ